MKVTEFCYFYFYSSVVNCVNCGKKASGIAYSQSESRVSTTWSKLTNQNAVSAQAATRYATWRRWEWNVKITHSDWSIVISWVTYGFLIGYMLSTLYTTTEVAFPGYRADAQIAFLGKVCSLKKIFFDSR